MIKLIIIEVIFGYLLLSYIFIIINHEFKNNAKIITFKLLNMYYNYN